MQRIVYTGLVLKVLLPFFVCLAVYNGDLFSQTKLSADVTIRQLHQNKVIRVEKQVFFTSNGNLVIHYTYPQEYYMITNSLGETSVYQPAANEVMNINDKSLSSQTEFFTLFMTPAYSDLNLTNLGFTLQGIKKDGSNIVKTFIPTQKADKEISKATVVCQKDKPIYSAFYDKSGKVLKKTYYTNYVTYPNISFPATITQISYDTKGDSVIKKEEYKNIKTNNFSKDALFDYKVPKGAKRVNPYNITQ